MKVLEQEGGLIPLVEIKVFEDELSQTESQELIQTVTDVIVSFAGENLRQATWVVVQEVKSGNWGVGGKALGLEDVRAIQEPQGIGLAVSRWFPVECHMGPATIQEGHWIACTSGQTGRRSTKCE